MTLSVIIITLNRPDCVWKCLDCLEKQSPKPDQIIVVDASPDERTKDVVSSFPHVVYLRNDLGVGRQTASRNIGLLASTGEIIAFLDDDAFARPGWAANLLATYTALDIAGVGGQVLNNQPDEESIGVHEIGRLFPDGRITGNFGANPGRIIEVDHLMGANMSFRRAAIAAVGGFREGFRAVSGNREETDISLCLKHSGYRLLFNPDAKVDHLGAPQVKGRRFDTRYAFNDRKNHYIMLILNYGVFSSIVMRFTISASGSSLSSFARRFGGAFLYLWSELSGSLFGIVLGCAWRFKQGANPRREDRLGEQIRSKLTNSPNDSLSPQSKQELSSVSIAR